VAAVRDSHNRLHPHLKQHSFCGCTGHQSRRLAFSTCTGRCPYGCPAANLMTILLPCGVFLLQVRMASSAATEAVQPFHLAIPVHDLDTARAFYGGVLGLKDGRSSKKWHDYSLYGTVRVTLGSSLPYSYRNHTVISFVPLGLATNLYATSCIRRTAAPTTSTRLVRDECWRPLFRTPVPDRADWAASF